MKKISVDPFVMTKKAVYMQRIADLARLNHTRYIQGQIAPDKAGYFAAKMDLNYHCFADKVTAFRARKVGFCSSRLLFFHTKSQTNLSWILMVTEGEWPTPHRGNEKWQDPTLPAGRLAFSGYELVRHIRSGNASPSWTWRYTSRQYDTLRDQIVLSIRRHNNSELEKLIDTIWRSPGFAGVRDQVKKFAELIKGEWTRTGAGDMPKLPKGMGFVRRLPDKGKVLSKLLKDIQDGTD
jgi:hypothetical protein